MGFVLKCGTFGTVEVTVERIIKQQINFKSWIALVTGALYGSGLS